MKRYMLAALEEAKKAYREDETPVGAVVVKNGEIISSAHNAAEFCQNPLKHAETAALEAAMEKLGEKKLSGCELYVTMEPCPMCAWAAILSGVSKIVFGAYDMNAGALGSFFNLSVHPSAKNTEIYGGICEKECAILLKEFFRGVRKNENKTF